MSIVVGSPKNGSRSSIAGKRDATADGDTSGTETAAAETGSGAEIGPTGGAKCGAGGVTIGVGAGADTGGGCAGRGGGCAAGGMTLAGGVGCGMLK